MAAALALALVLVVACDYAAKTSVGFGATVSADASLRALQISSGTLTPAFDSATISYVVAVPLATASITVTPTATNSGATITVNGAVVASGSLSPGIALAVGTSTILVGVTASDTTTRRTYTLTVVRATT
jgi:hypothetical protein